MRGGAVALAGAMVARPMMAASVERFQELPTPQDERMKKLIQTAVDAAMQSGAKYADARLTFTQEMQIQAGGFATAKTGGIADRQEMLGFGVRALYDGYWGFVSSSVWTNEEAARLGRSVVEDAKANVLGKPRELEMAPNRGAKSGDWVMPVKDDPFEMSPEEIYDYLSGLQEYIWMLPGDSKQGITESINVSGRFSRQQKGFGSSDGQFLTQRVYRTGGNVSFTVKDQPWDGGARAAGELDQIRMSGAGLGFEYIRHSQTREWVRKLYEDLLEEMRLPYVPVEVGRYLSLIHPIAVAEILCKSIGVATEVDRVMGFEANAGGTSYIVDPDAMLGILKIGASAMQVTGTRSSPGTIACVKWDDEGVEPKDFQLIKDGVLVNLQTNREGTGWIKSHYEKTGQPISSSGCSFAPDAGDPQLVHPADLILHPDSAHDTSIDRLREQIDKGVEWKTPSLVSMDFQQATGFMTASAFEIKNGKRVARIAGPGMLYKTSELWGNLQQLGGPGTVLRVGVQHWKGEPMQVAYSSVDTPAALFKEMSVINPSEKA